MHERGVISVKLVKAIIRPDQLGYVRKALEENGFYDMIITTVEVHSRYPGISPDAPRHLTDFELLPHIQIEITVNYNKVDHLISTITESCQAENESDDRIYVLPVEKAIRILKGEVIEESLDARAIGIEFFTIPQSVATEE